MNDPLELLMQKMAALLYKSNGRLSGGFLSVTDGVYRVTVSSNNPIEGAKTTNPGECYNPYHCAGSDNGTCDNGVGACPESNNTKCLIKPQQGGYNYPTQ